MKLAISNSSFTGLSFEEQCEATAELGAQGLLLTPRTISPRGNALLLEPSQGEYLLATAQFHGLEIVGLEDLLVGSDQVLDRHLPLKASAAESLDEIAAYLLHLGKICYAMEGKLMLLGSAKERKVQGDLSVDEAAQTFTSILQRLAGEVVKAEITLAIDARPYKETNFINSAREAAIMQKLVGQPNCQLAFNTDTLLLELDPKTPNAPTPKGATASDAQIAHYIRELIHFHREHLAHLQFGAALDLALLPSALALRETDYQSWVSLKTPPKQDDPLSLLTKKVGELRSLLSL